MKINYARYLIGVQYKGPRFNGWNSSLDAKLPSVSETLKIAISKFIGERNFDNFTQKLIRIISIRGRIFHR